MAISVAKFTFPNGGVKTCHWGGAKFRAPVSHDPQHRQVMLIMERQHPVIEQISGSDGRFGRVKLGMCIFSVDCRPDPGSVVAESY